MSALCREDSGAMTGCRPVCAELATVTVIIPCHTGCELRLVRCRRHADRVAARIWPARVIREELTT
jgi:hypothetical protein